MPDKELGNGVQAFSGGETMSDLEIPYTFVEDTDAEAAQVNANFAAIKDFVNALVVEAVGQGVPLGVPLPFGGAEAPGGYVLCQGQALSRSAYSALFAVLGTRFGAGNGSTTFNLPDLRGRAPFGADGGAGRLSASNAVGQAAGSQHMPAHTHTMPSHTHGKGSLSVDGHRHAGLFWTTIKIPSSGSDFPATLPSGNSIVKSPYDTDYAGASISGDTASGGGGNTGSTGNANSANNMPPYQVFNWILRSGL